MLKFNFIFVPLVALFLSAVAYSTRSLLQENAKVQITQNARIMMETASSSRVYTTKQVQPLLQHKNFKLQAAIEEFKKALDDLSKDGDSVRPPEAFETRAKNESEAKEKEMAALSREPAEVPEVTPKVAPETSPKVASESGAKKAATADAKAATSTKEVTDSNPKKPQVGFWQRLFGTGPKEAPPAVVAKEESVPAPVEASHLTGNNKEAPVVAAEEGPASTPSEPIAPVVKKKPVASVNDDSGTSAKDAFLLGRQRVLDQQKKYIDSLMSKPDEMLDTEFHPQSVPAYAATEIFNILRAKYPDYFYKEATLNPSNLRNRAADWEADLVNSFRGNPTLPELIGTRDTPIGAALFLARPIKVTNVSCLTCHSTPDKAPPEMIKLYGSANGFGWKMDEIIGAQVVSVPMSVPLSMADAAWKSLNRWLVAAFAGIIFAGNLGFGIFARRDKTAALQADKP